MMLEDFVDTLGHSVAGTADCVADALARVEAGGVDIAILDVHLRGGEPSWPVADLLADRGIAFLISTGGHVDPPPAAPRRRAAAGQAVHDGRHRGGDRRHGLRLIRLRSLLVLDRANRAIPAWR